MMTDGRFDLVTLDLDGTLLPGDTAFAAVLRANGRGEDVAASDARYFAGGQSLADTFWQQWAWVQELTLADLSRGLRKTAWLPGIAEGVRRLKDAGLRVCLLTDQPTTVTDFLARWGLTDAIASPVTVREGRQVSVHFEEDKLDNLRTRLAEWHIPLDRICHVGNGQNDVPVWRAGATGVACFASPEVAAEAEVDLGRPADLGAVVDAVLGLHRGGK